MKKKFRLYLFLLIGASIFLNYSCKKSGINNPPPTPPPTPTGLVPLLATNSVGSITSNSATCGGNISSDGGSAVIARGVCWSLGGKFGGIDHLFSFVIDHQEKKLFYNLQPFIYNAHQILIQVVNGFRKWVVNLVGISNKTPTYEVEETILHDVDKDDIAVHEVTSIYGGETVLLKAILDNTGRVFMDGLIDVIQLYNNPEHLLLKLNNYFHVDYVEKLLKKYSGGFFNWNKPFNCLIDLDGNILIEPTGYDICYDEEMKAFVNEYRKEYVLGI